MFGRQACCQDILLVIEELGGNLHDLLGRFARAKNHFRKAFTQGAMRVHLRETNIGDWRGLKGLKDFVAAHPAGAEFLQELNRFGRCHARTMPQKPPLVTPENALTNLP